MRTGRPDTGETMSSASHSDPATTSTSGEPAPRPPEIRVVRVLGAFDIGGAEQRTIELLPRLAASAVRTSFVTLSGVKGARGEEVERLGSRIHPIRLDRRFPVRFYRLLREIRPHAVHSDVATFSGFVLFLAALARVPIRIAHFRSDRDGHPDSLRRRLQRGVMVRLIHFCATDVLGVAPGALTSCYRPSWENDPRCRVLPNGLDLGRLHRRSTLRLRDEIGAAPDDLVCVVIGRPHPLKRRSMVPSIVAALRERGIGCRAVFVGPHDDRDDDAVRQAATRHDVLDRMHLVGPRADVGEFLAQADLLLQPSALEGLPGTVLEARAVGTPVVASDLPGARFIDDQLAGVTLVPVDADAERWADAVHRLGLVPGRPTGGRRALAAFQDSVFTMERSVEQHLAIYCRNTLAPRGGADRPAVPTG